MKKIPAQQQWALILCGFLHTFGLQGQVFTGVSTGAIVTDAHDSAAAVWGDVNGDGREDLYVVNHNQQNALYLNGGNSTFVKAGGIPPVQPADGGLAASMGDIDNDGDLDLFVSNVGNDRLYRNDGNGAWTAMTNDPTGQDGLISSGGAWGDFDGDGYVDLAIAMGGGGASTQNRLYRNLGNGSFELLTSGAVAQSTGYNISASWADYDGDRDLDLLLTGDNLLFRNNGDGNFTRITATPISTVSGFPFGGAWADYDRDGDFDLLIVNLLGDPILYRNVGSGSFSSLVPSAFVGLRAASVAWGDFDQDGFEDVAMAQRGGPIVVLRNDQIGGFSASISLPNGPTAYGNSVSWVDHDNDGDLDLFAARGGNTGSVNNQTNVLFNNSGSFNGWLKVKLNGTFSNRQGVGAKIRVIARLGGTTRQQLRQIGGGDSYGGASLIGHFGLGNAAVVDQLIVEWPSGRSEILSNVGINQQITIHELDSDLSCVIPAGLESVDGDYYGGLLHESQIRLQTVYGASNFPTGPKTITELRFRRDINEPPFGSATAAISVRLSTTTLGPGQLYQTFSQNTGPDETTVFSGLWTYSSPSTVNSGVVRPFDIVLPLTTPFGYDPSIGNLLVDVKITSNTALNWTDGASGVSRQVSRVVSLDANSLSGNAGELTGDVLQIVYQASPIVGFVPPSGTFTNSVQVSIQSGVSNSVIRYTTDGNDPTGASTAYTGPFTLTQTRTVKARLFVNGFPASEIVEATYTRYVPPDIQFIPAGQLFTNQLNVALVNHVGGGTTIRYTLNGSAPTSTSTAYAGPINLTAAATIRAQVYLGNFFVSDVFTEDYARVYAFANDGVPFAWREQYFGPGFLTNPCAAADADCDDDGYVVAEEYQYSTDPTDGDSAPEIILTVRAVPRLTFTTIAGRGYRIQRTETLNPPDWQTIVESVLATGPELHYVDEEAPDNSYYQVELIRD